MAINKIPAVNPQTDADYAHRSAVRLAHQAHDDDGDLNKYAEGVALDMAAHETDPAAVAAYVWAFRSTTRALAIEDRERHKSSHEAYLERTYPGDTQYDRARRAGHNEACATAQHMAMVDTCTCGRR